MPVALLITPMITPAELERTDWSDLTVLWIVLGAVVIWIIVAIIEDMG